MSATDRSVLAAFAVAVHTAGAGIQRARGTWREVRGEGSNTRVRAALRAVELAMRDLLEAAGQLESDLVAGTPVLARPLLRAAHLVGTLPLRATAEVLAASDVVIHTAGNDKVFRQQKKAGGAYGGGQGRK